jgi:molybdopterin converting factor subunit 1
MTSAPCESSETFEVLLFGALKDAAQANRVTVHAPHSLCVSQLLEITADQFPSLKKYLPHIRVAVNCEYSAPDQNIQSGDEIALIPPVAGGCKVL